MNAEFWLLHPDIYPQIRDDRDPETFEIPESCIFHFYGPKGMIAYNRHEQYRIHPCIHPDYRREAYDIVMDSIHRINVDLEAVIPLCFRHVKIFAHRCGFETVDILPNDYLRDGQWHDSALMERKRQWGL